MSDRENRCVQKRTHPTANKYKLVVFFIIVCFLTSCFPEKNLWPTSLPKSDILFQSTMVTRPYTLNFIRANGSNLQKMILDENFAKATYSNDYAILYGLSSPGGYPIFEFGGYPAYWNLKTGRFKRCSENLNLFVNIVSDPVEDKSNLVFLNTYRDIILFNIDTCQEIQKIVDYSDYPGQVHIAGISYSSSRHELVYGLITEKMGLYNTRVYSLIKHNMENGEEVDLGKGINPALTPDEKQLAFVNEDGIYIMQADGSQTHQILKTQFYDPLGDTNPVENAPRPSWSSDGKWLVYHQCVDWLCDVDQTPIYKIQVSDGMQVKIFAGGKFPIWQP